MIALANVEKKDTNKPVKQTKTRRFRPIQYMKEVFAELKKLTWPTPRELTSHTVAVLVFVLGIAVIIGVLDLAFSQGLNLLATIGG